MTLTSCKNNGSNNHELVDYLPEHTQSLLKINHWKPLPVTFTKPVINQMDGEPFFIFKNKLAAFPYVTAKINVVFFKQGKRYHTCLHPNWRASSTQFYLIRFRSPNLSFEFEGTQIRKINLKEHLLLHSIRQYGHYLDFGNSGQGIASKKIPKDSILKRPPPRQKTKKELTHVGTLKHGVFQDSIPQN